MTYFTADLHLGHEGIIRFCNRPFDSVSEMDKALILNWNSRVTARDDIYILGDLFHKNKENAEDILKRLKGRKHLVIGNHDGWLKNIDAGKYFVEVDKMIELKMDGIEMALCHYPLLSWPHMHQGGYCIFGHIHNNKEEAGWPFIQANPLLLNAGVDINGFYPVPFSELVMNNETFKLGNQPYSENQRPYPKQQ